MKSRITMLGISRWNEKHSYKTIERFFDKKLNWLEIKWQLIKKVIGKEVILVADESTISKAGKKTYGLGYFYSGLQSRPIKGISFLSFSLIDVEERRAYPIFTKQMKKSKKKEIKKEPKKKVGRPKGSKNKNSKDKRLTGTFKVVSYFLKIILKVVKIPTLRYFVYDGAFGNNAGIQATKKANLHLISKLKKNSALYFKCNKKRKGRGRPTIYGEKIDLNSLDEKYYKDTQIDNDIELKFYQFEALHKTISGSLNIVIVYSKNLKTKKETHTILFSTDLKQDYQKIVDYYSLRFQIEFNFRDAKQFFGLEDFMNVKKRRIHNFANLSMFMNSLSYLIHKKSDFSNYSVNDIKSIFIAERYTHEVLKLYGKKVDDILINEAIRKVSQFTLIHQSSA